MCKYCEKRTESKHEWKYTSSKHPHYHWVEVRVAKNPIWLTERVEVPYEEDTIVDVYLDVDTHKLNGKIKINYCPFCGRKLIYKENAED